MSASLSLRVVRLGLLSAAALLVACGSLLPSAYREVGATPGGTAIGENEIVLVGRIEIIPAISATEQQLRVGAFDPADMEGTLRQRAVLFLTSDEPRTRGVSGRYINPRLGEWFMYVVPKSHRFVSQASVFMEYAPTLTSRRRATIETEELLLPAPVDLGLGEDDRAVYIGTWRIWRDQFHQATKVQVANEQAAARSALQKAGLSSHSMRVAIPALKL